MSDKYKFCRKTSHINCYKENIFQLGYGHNSNKRKSEINDSKCRINDKKYFLKRTIIFENIIIKILLFFMPILNCNQRQLLAKSSNINLKTKGKYYTKILSDPFYRDNQNMLNEVYVNDEKTPKKNHFDSKKDINNVSLIWNDYLTSINDMFYGCNKIIEIDLSSFDTSKVINMNKMFYGCSSLTSIDLSNLDTGNVKDMSNMFYNCKKITEIDLSSFDTSEVTNMNRMFYECSSMTSIYISNLKTSKVEDMNHMFYKCSKLKSLDFSSFETSMVKNMEFMFFECSSLSSLNLSNFNTEKVTSFNKMFKKCNSLLYINLESAYCNENIKNNNLFQIFEQTSEDLIVFSRNECLEKDLKEKKVIKCINNGQENEFNVFSKKFKEINNIICVFCGKNFLLDNNNVGDYINCTFQEGYSIVIKEELENEQNSSGDEEEKEESKIDPAEVQIIIDSLINELDIITIDEGMDIEIPIEDIIVKFTSTSNQKNNEKENDINLNLGKCEDNLKSIYNISINDSIYILEVISNEPGMNIPKIEYELYYPLNNSDNLNKLDLSLCKDTKIEISISVQINDTLDKYNSSSDYYNDICTTITSSDGTDITLKDRRNDFVDNNMSLCEENCELIDYIQENDKAKCSCDVKLSLASFDNLNFDKNEFFKNFIDIKNIANFSILKCFKQVMKGKNLLKNYGFFIMSFILLLYFVTLILFIIKSYDKLKADMFNAFSSLKSSEIIKGKENQYPQAPNKKKRFYKKKIILENDNNNENKNDGNAIKLKNYKKEIKENNNIFTQITQNLEVHSINEINKTNSLKLEDKTNMKDIMELKDFELNSLDYEDALRLDNRNYFQYYISLIKNYHPLMFSFAPFKDYNSRIIKIFLFFFSFSLDFTVNALFFTDETMHQIHQDKGKFNFLYQIPQILYSSIISRFIDGLIKNFALSQDIFVSLKQQKNKKPLNNTYFTKYLKDIKNKFIAFFIYSFIILICFGYYIICFCGIYINTQIHLIKDSIISLFTSFLLAFIMFLVPGIFRISSLRVVQPTRKYLYKLSIFIENYL